MGKIFALHMADHGLILQALPMVLEISPEVALSTDPEVRSEQSRVDPKVEKRLDLKAYVLP